MVELFDHNKRRASRADHAFNLPPARPGDGNILLARIRVRGLKKVFRSPTSRREWRETMLQTLAMAVKRREVGEMLDKQGQGKSKLKVKKSA